MSNPVITKKEIEQIIKDSFIKDIQNFPEFDFLIDEIVLFINSNSINEYYFEELIDFVFQGRNMVKYLPMQEYLNENKYLFED